LKRSLGKSQTSLDISHKSKISFPCQELNPRSSHTNYAYSPKYNTTTTTNNNTSVGIEIHIIGKWACEFCLEIIVFFNITGNGWDQTWDFLNTGTEQQRAAERNWTNLIKT
jgi:hypothetical protein